eukprot:tig00000430_g618.t1
MSASSTPPPPRGTPVGGRDPEGSAQNDVSLVIDDKEPYVYLGNCACAADLERLRKLLTNPLTGQSGAIVNTAGNFPCLYTDEFTYKHFVLVDDCEQEVVGWFDEAARFIDEQRRAGKRVLVHCMQGFSRSATMLLAYLVAVQRMPLAKAFELCCSRRTIRPNRFFLEQLLEFERRHLGSASIDLRELFATGYSVQGDEAYVERTTGERVLHGLHRGLNKLNSVRVFARVIAGSDLRTSGTVISTLLSYAFSRRSKPGAGAGADLPAPGEEGPPPADSAAAAPRVRSAGPGAPPPSDSDPMS